MYRRIIFRVIRHCGLGYMTAAWMLAFCVCSASVAIADPSTYTFWDGVWYSFQAVTTIGYGDIITQSTLVRVCTIALSTISVFYLALLTAGVVSYCTEIQNVKRRGSLEETAHKLEHLEDLSREELAELSAAVRRHIDSR